MELLQPEALTRERDIFTDGTDFGLSRLGCRNGWAGCIVRRCLTGAAKRFVPIDMIENERILFDGIPLGKMSASMTITPRVVGRSAWSTPGRQQPRPVESEAAMDPPPAE